MVFFFLKQSAEPECIVMLLGNKLDLADDGFRKISTEMGERLAKVRPVAKKSRLISDSDVIFQITSGESVRKIIIFITILCLAVAKHFFWSLFALVLFVVFRSKIFYFFSGFFSVV